jgi:hypothetical protein
MNQKIVLGIIIALLSLATYASAVPAGPRSIDRPYDTRWPTWDPITQEAIAGNVSELNFNASTITRTYQGYVGNVSGYIVLGDTNNNTLYDWTLASPQGEIYAVASVTPPSWDTVICAPPAEIVFEDARLGVNEAIDEDSVNSTFVQNGAPDQIARFGGDLGHPSFWTASQNILEDACPVATLYEGDGTPSTDFKEVLLSDNVNTGAGGFIIYTALISHTINPYGDSTGFDDRVYDFEMMVGENGHGAQDGAGATSTTYWFYLELD